MLGIIVLNYNTPKQTCECIRSIIKNCKIEYEIIVVDNNSTDNSKDIFRKELSNDPKIKVILSDSNNGYSSGNNIGIKALDKNVDAVLISNSDVIWNNDIGSYMYETLFKSDSIAAVGPSIKNSEGEESQFVRRKLKVKDIMIDRKPFVYLKIKNDRHLADNKNLFGKEYRGMVSGCCFMIKREVFKSINYFDENIFLFNEEDILAYKLDEINMNVVVDNRAKIIHNHSVSVSKKGIPFRRMYSLLSPLYVLKKYGKIRNTTLLFICVITAFPYMIYSVFFKDYRSYRRNFLSLLIKYINA